MELQDIFEEKCWFTKTGQVILDVWSMCLLCYGETSFFFIWQVTLFSDEWCVF